MHQWITPAVGIGLYVTSCPPPREVTKLSDPELVFQVSFPGARDLYKSFDGRSRNIECRFALTNRWPESRSLRLCALAGFFLGRSGCGADHAHVLRSGISRILWPRETPYRNGASRPDGRPLCEDPDLTEIPASGSTALRSVSGRSTWPPAPVGKLRSRY
jgi:hypothetical protein